MEGCAARKQGNPGPVDAMPTHLLHGAAWLPGLSRMPCPTRTAIDLTWLALCPGTVARLCTAEQPASACPSHTAREPHFLLCSRSPLLLCLWPPPAHHAPTPAHGDTAHVPAPWKLAARPEVCGYAPSFGGGNASQVPAGAACLPARGYAVIRTASAPAAAFHPGAAPAEPLRSGPAPPPTGTAPRDAPRRRTRAAPAPAR
jgi:hypothetical protein